MSDEQRRIDVPVAGYFKRRARSKGPWLPAMIYEVPARDPQTLASMERSAALVCVVDGEERDLEREWPGLHPISKEEYEAMATLRLDPEQVPDFGQTERNDRCAALAAAAALALSEIQWPRTPEWFRKVSLLVKQTTVAETNSEEGYAHDAKPLREQIERLRAEWKCEASEHKKALRQALTDYAEEHGIPPCPETAPHWRDMPARVVVTESDRVPRDLCTPDTDKIRRALERGEVVPGVTVTSSRQIVVV